MPVNAAGPERPALLTHSRTLFRIEAILCDLDGVLINTEPYKYLAYVQVLVRRQVPLAALERIGFLAHYKSHCVGRTRQESVAEQLHFLAEHGFDLGLSAEQYAAERRRYYEPIRDELPLIEKNAAFLRRIPKACPIYLVSRTQPAEVARIMVSFGPQLPRLIPAVEPKEAKFGRALAAAGEKGVSADRCIAIEDTAAGVVEAKAAGLFAIAVPNEFTEGQDFSQADAVTDDLANVILV